jgi:hypothetical protein
VQALYVGQDLLAMARPDWRLLVVYPSLWALIIVHDAWFYTVHAVLHR